MSDRVEIVWRFVGIDANDVDECLVSLRQCDPRATLSELPHQSGAFPVDIGAGVMGSATIVAIAARIMDIVCRARKHGTIIDARVTPLHITTTRDLPGGTVVTIDAAGHEIVHDACRRGFDLVSTVDMLVRSRSHT